MQHFQPWTWPNKCLARGNVHDFKWSKFYSLERFKIVSRWFDLPWLSRCQLSWSLCPMDQVWSASEIFCVSYWPTKFQPNRSRKFVFPRPRRTSEIHVSWCVFDINWSFSDQYFTNIFCSSDLQLRSWCSQWKWRSLFQPFICDKHNASKSFSEGFPISMINFRQFIKFLSLHESILIAIFLLLSLRCQFITMALQWCSELVYSTISSFFSIITPKESKEFTCFTDEIDALHNAAFNFCAFYSVKMSSMIFLTCHESNSPILSACLKIPLTLYLNLS